MTRCIAVILLLILFTGECFAAGLEQVPNPAQKMEIQLLRLPPSFFSAPNLSNDKGERKYIKGVVPIDGYGTRYDVKKVLESMGIGFPPGSEATFFEDVSILYVRNSKENMDLVEIIGPTDSGGFFLMVDIELSAIECSLPAKQMLPISKRLSYSELVQLAGKSMKLLDRVSLLQRSGQRGVVSHIVNPASNTPATSGTSQDSFQKPFASGESGTKAEVESIIGPDGMTSEVNLNYSYQHAAEQKSARSASSINVLTTFAAPDHVPMVVEIVPVPNREGKYIAIIALVRLTNPTGWKYRDPSGAEKQASPASTKLAPASPGPSPENARGKQKEKR